MDCEGYGEVEGGVEERRGQEIWGGTGEGEREGEGEERGREDEGGREQE